MKRALFKSVNLIGDALYISPALRQWHQQNPDYEIEIQTLNDHVARLYYGMGVPLRAIHNYQPKLQYDFQHTFDVNQAFKLSDEKKQHIAESYADLLGVKLDKKLRCADNDPERDCKCGGERGKSSCMFPGTDMSHVGPFYEPPKDLEMVTSPEAVLVSMFSASCSSRGNPPGPPNKMLLTYKWKPILKAIRKQFPLSPIWFLGAPTDQVPQELLELIQNNGGPMLGIPLDRLALVMRDCKFVVTLDNGMAHLAASQKVREFVFYPRALGTHYILPVGNSNMRYVHMDPNTISPAEILWRLQTAWKEWGLV